LTRGTQPAQDLAFSFLQEDEHVALQINELVKDRLPTFIYSEHQEELAGTDGEKTLNRVFSDEARVVVVLYREGWGETPWIDCSRLRGIDRRTVRASVM
jgi:hypothetical protein